MQIAEEHVHHKNKVNHMTSMFGLDKAVTDFYYNGPIIFAVKSVSWRHTAGSCACQRCQGEAGVPRWLVLPWASGKTSSHPSEETLNRLWPFQKTKSTMKTKLFSQHIKIEKYKLLKNERVNKETRRHVVLGIAWFSMQWFSFVYFFPWI